MRFFCLAALLASACAFTSQPAAFPTQGPVVGERAINDVVAPSSSHRNRRATIGMDGKANGKFQIDCISGRTNAERKVSEVRE
jgi:hypothetical protein